MGLMLLSWIRSTCWRNVTSRLKLFPQSLDTIAHYSSFTAKPIFRPLDIRKKEDFCLQIKKKKLPCSLSQEKSYLSKICCPVSFHPTGAQSSSLTWTWHLKGLSSECISLWESRLYFLVNTRSHSSHGYSRRTEVEIWMFAGELSMIEPMPL